MVGFSLDFAVDKIAKKLQNIQEEQIPFALEGSMRETVKAAADAAQKGAERAFTNPTEQLKTRPTDRKGGNAVIRYQYDNKKQIQRKGVKHAQAKVFVLEYLTEEMHLQIFGGETKNVPEGFDGVMVPTRAVIKGLAGRGRLRHLNKYGNIQELYKGASIKWAKRQDEFVNVPLTGAPPEVRNLHAGLYIRVFGDSAVPYTRQYANRRRQRSRRRGRGNSGRFRENGGRQTQLIMLIAYELKQKYKRRFPYDQIVMREYESRFPIEYQKKLSQAIRTAR